MVGYYFVLQHVFPHCYHKVYVVLCCLFADEVIVCSVYLVYCVFVVCQDCDDHVLVEAGLWHELCEVLIHYHVVSPFLGHHLLFCSLAGFVLCLRDVVVVVVLVDLLSHLRFLFVGEVVWEWLAISVVFEEFAGGADGSIHAVVDFPFGQYVFSYCCE